MDKNRRFLIWETVISAENFGNNKLFSAGMAFSVSILKDLSNEVFCYIMFSPFEEIAKDRGHELGETHNKMWIC